MSNKNQKADIGKLTSKVRALYVFVIIVFSERYLPEAITVPMFTEG
jgi:hypothetical protein